MIWIFLSTVKNIKDEEKGNEPVHKIVKTYVLKHRIHQLNKNVYKKKKKNFGKNHEASSREYLPGKQNKCFDKYLAKQHIYFKYSKCLHFKIVGKILFQREIHLISSKTLKLFSSFAFN